MLGPDAAEAQEDQMTLIEAVAKAIAKTFSMPEVGPHDRRCARAAIRAVRKWDRRVRGERWKKATR